MSMSERARTRRAILCVCAASALFALGAGLVKSVRPEIPVVEMMLFRSVFAALILWPVLARGGITLRTRLPLGHVLRTVAGLAGMFGTYYGTVHLPLATVTALGFTMPMMLASLSVLVLHERVSAPRLMAILAGLVGVLVMLRPWNVAQALPVVPLVVVFVGVLAWAVAMLSIRRMGAKGEANGTIVMWFTLGASLVCGVLTLPVWVTPRWIDVVSLIALGLLSGLAQMLMTEGYRSADSSLVAPFEYGSIVYTTALGIVFWGEYPDLWSFVGIAILVAAGTLVWRRG
jgi:drug/metabolite transporter (DMT)-like permease